MRWPAPPKWRWRSKRIAREHPEDGMVGTVGRIEASPGAVNIIPGRVVFTVDLRALTDALRVAAVERFAAEAQRIAAARGLKVAIEPFHEIATAHCAPALQDAAGRERRAISATRRSGCRRAPATTRR